MIRLVSCALFVGACVSLVAGSVRAELPVAPPPREVRPDGTRDPVPQPAPKGEDPAVTVERIIKNSKDVGDKLSKTDTGADTLKTQGKILSDIDSLINRQENPPPKPDDKDKDKDKNKEQKPDQMMDPNMMPMKPDMPMDKKGMGNMDMQPMPGMNDPPPMGIRRPRLGDQTKDKQEPGDTQKNPNKQPNNTEPKDPSGMTGGIPSGKTQVMPMFPYDEHVQKEVWGHLPDKLRQQMTQFYKEDHMPKYTELLRLYYSSLSEKGAKPGMPKK